MHTECTPVSMRFARLKGRDVVGCFLFSEEVDTDIFSDAVEPAVKRSLSAEGMDSTKRFYPCFLCEVLGGFSIFYTSEDVRIDFRMVFLHQGIKGFSIAMLDLLNEGIFVKIKQSSGLHFHSLPDRK